MKNEKKASVLSTSQYSVDELTLYGDKTMQAKKQLSAVNNKKPSYIESLSFSSDSKMNQFGPIAYDLNTLDIDLNIHASSISTEQYSSTSERFQTMDAQYEFDCNYAKTSSEMHAVADMILKRKRRLT